MDFFPVSIIKSYFCFLLQKIRTVEQDGKTIKLQIVRVVPISLTLPTRQNAKAEKLLFHVIMIIPLFFYLVSGTLLDKSVSGQSQAVITGVLMELL